MKTGFSVTQIGAMDLSSLKQNALLLGPEEIGNAIEWANRDNAPMPTPYMEIGSPYSVIFQDPLKPAGTAFKAFSCVANSVFKLSGIRSTVKNRIIFLFDVDENTKRNLDRFKVGPGLDSEWKKAEFTMSKMNPTRLNAVSFLASVLHMHRNWAASTGANSLTYKGAQAGSW
tara:strand:- start:1042 stop:1557 length:516 start_codon:yes stop_codon:yes gene_type:complete